MEEDEAEKILPYFSFLKKFQEIFGKHVTKWVNSPC